MKELKRKLKRALKPYHIATTICLIVLIISLCIILKPETKKTPSGITVVSSKTKENEEITEEEAIKIATEKDKQIEKNINEFLSLENPTRELIINLVEKIYIYQDKTIDIIFTFNNVT